VSAAFAPRPTAESIVNPQPPPIEEIRYIMAKVHKNLVIHGLSGILGEQLVVCRQKNGGYVIAAAPGPRTNQQLSDAQKQHQEHFRQAILYPLTCRNQ
jgi:hypothetical protein